MSCTLPVRRPFGTTGIDHEVEVDRREQQVLVRPLAARAIPAGMRLKSSSFTSPLEPRPLPVPSGAGLSGSAVKDWGGGGPQWR